MIRLAALLALLCGPAMAQQTQCPGSNQSWSFSLPAPMQWAVFDLSVPPGAQPNPLSRIPTGLLSILYQDRTALTFIGVPQTVAQAFQTSSNQTNFFTRQVAPVYHELLLLQGSNCPLLTSQPGVLWSK